MKTKQFAILLLAFTLSQIQANATITANPALDTSGATICNTCSSKDGDPADIKVVVSQKRIWLVADEMPMKCLKAQVKNTEGKIVLEKCFTSKCAEWSLNIEALPKGEYTLCLGANQIEKFKK